MPKKRAESPEPAVEKQPVPQEKQNSTMEALGFRFEQALRVVDAAITGALFAGIEPYSFEGVLSYEFMRVAAGLREKTQFELDSWMKTDRFGQVVEAIVAVFEDERENVVDAMEADQFFSLRAICQDGELSAFEFNRETEIALSIVDWAILKIAEDEDLEMILVEMALLICWLKVAALGGTIEAETYIKVRHDPPRLLMAYHDVLE